MGRPRAFDESVPLDQIVQMFWSRGYAVTSVRDLERSTGIGTTNLYNAFGSKRELLCATLARYSEQQTRAFIRDIEGIPSPTARIRTPIERITEAALHGADRMDCLAINTATELTPHDFEIATIVASDLAEVEVFFRRNLESAIAAGEAAPDLSADDVVRAFSALMFAFRVLARTCLDRAIIEGATRPLLALLQEAGSAAVDRPHITPLQMESPNDT